MHLCLNIIMNTVIGNVYLNPTNYRHARSHALNPTNASVQVSPCIAYYRSMDSIPHRPIELHIYDVRAPTTGLMPCTIIVYNYSGAQKTHIDARWHSLRRELRHSANATPLPVDATFVNKHADTCVPLCYPLCTCTYYILGRQKKNTSSHTHTFHPLSTIVIHTFNNLCKVQSMDDNCGEWVECMGVASGCGEQEAGVDSGSG